MTDKLMEMSKAEVENLDTVGRLLIGGIIFAISNAVVRPEDDRAHSAAEALEAADAFITNAKSNHCWPTGV